MIRWLAAVLFAVFCTSFATPALAQDTDDEFFFDEEEGSESDQEDQDSEESDDDDDEEGDDDASEEDAGDTKPAPLDDDEFDDGDDDILFEDEVDEESGEVLEDDLLEGEEDVEEEVVQPGTDSAEVYREAASDYAELESEDEVMAWEQYLDEYPNSLFKDRIQERVDLLLQNQFAMRIDEEGGRANASDAEIILVRPAHLTNVNPRTMLTAGLEFGFPGYIRANADFEYAILRRLSVHGGISGRYHGWGLEAGTKYAFVKSAKDQVVASALLDFRLNFNALFFQVRPQLAVGKIFGPVQLLATFGAEIETRQGAGVAFIGGAHVAARLAPAVGIFVETDFHVRNVGREAGAFAFDLATIGLRFYPQFKKRPGEDVLEIHAAGHAAAASRYLSYFLGSVQAQGVYYLPSK
jgi:hypothetical protein